MISSAPYCVCSNEWTGSLCEKVYCDGTGGKTAESWTGSACQINTQLSLSGDSFVDAVSYPELELSETTISFILNDALSTITFPKLTRVASSFLVYNNPVLTSITAPLVDYVGGSVRICANGGLLNVSGLSSIYGSASGNVCKLKNGSGTCPANFGACVSPP